MRGTTRFRGFEGLFPPAIKWLLVANGAVFVLELVVGAIFRTDVLLVVFGLRPATVIARGWVWQPLTYLFLHAGFFHILFNMFVLWMFGAEIERLWGWREFLKYYFLCGLGAAAFLFVFNYHSYTIGASGAVLGVMLAFGMMFPDRYIYLWFLIPIRAKYLVAGLAALEVVFLVTRAGGGIADAAHLGGMATGWIYLRGARGGAVDRLVERWRRRKLEVIEGGRSRSSGSPEREAEIDRILDKISRHGLDSLTPEEERILDEASRRDRGE